MIAALRRHWKPIAAAVVVLVAGAGLAAYFLDEIIETRLRPATIRLLSERFDSEVELSEMDVRVFPRLGIRVAGVSLRHQGRTDVPPLITMQSMTFETSVWRLRQSHIDSIRIDGLEIVIPPDRSGGMPSIRRDDAEREPGREDDGEDDGRPDVYVGEILSENARLTIMPKNPAKSPRVFDLFRFRMEGLQFEQPTPFQATLTNPVPAGRIETTGTFGPWVGARPAETPVTGSFTFNADLGTIKGIGGALDATGIYRGPLERIETSGKTSTPDFRIVALDGNALPLDTEFAAVVDGTNGDVILDSVVATLGSSRFETSGAVVGQKGVKGRFIRLDINGREVRLEDVLRLAMKGEQPAMTGGLDLSARLDIVPGEPDVVDRLTLDGHFVIDEARFTNDEVQDKIDGLARRGSGRPKDQSIDNVMSNMRGTFTLGDGRLRLPNVTFGVQGATVAMGGRYNLKSEALDFRGVVRLRASASQTMTGFKSLLLKPFDALLRKRGAGTRLAIKVTGTRSKPEFGVEIGRTLKGK